MNEKVSSSCNHENDYISRQAAMDFVGSMEMCDEISVEAYQKLMNYLEELPSAQPERPEQDILAWLLAYHMKSFDLKGRYIAHEVIGWLVHDFATAYMAER